MLKACGISSLEQLVEQAVPSGIRLSRPPQLPPSRSEHGLLQELRGIQGFWSRKARERGLITEQDLQRYLDG